MKKIGIIGGGFSGTMTAVQLITKTPVPLSISIINEKESFNKANLLIRDSSISEGMRVYKSVLMDTAHTNDGWYDVAIEQLYNGGRFNEAYEISKLKVIKKSGKINKRDLFYMDRALNKSKKY